MTDQPDNAYLEKLRSIGFVSKGGTAKRKVEKADKATLITTEHWDGRVDATVRPDTVRHGARVHNTGKKKGEVAEIYPMTNKERKGRYGDET